MGNACLSLNSGAFDKLTELGGGGAGAGAGAGTTAPPPPQRPASGRACQILLATS
jgi:hypothetical protein